MKVELEFLDMSKVRIHEDMIFINDGTPVPNAGERIMMEGIQYVVKSRDFIYLSSGGRNLKISFWCEEITR